MSELRASQMHTPTAGRRADGGIQIDANDNVTINNLTADGQGIVTSVPYSNMLMNCGFSVNQRNPNITQLNLTTAQSAYVSDRWLAVTTGANCTMVYGSPPEASPEAIQLVFTPAGDATTIQLIQSIELPLVGHNAPMSTGEYTFSIVTNMQDDAGNPVAPVLNLVQFRQGTVTGADGTNASSAALPAMTVVRDAAALGYGAGYQQWSCTFTVDQAAAGTNRCCNIGVQFAGHESNVFIVLCPQLTRGGSAPIPTSKPFALEWQDCLRYYYVDRTDRNGTWATSGTTGYVMSSFPQVMRRSPTVTAAGVTTTIDSISTTGWRCFAAGPNYATVTAPIVHDAEFNT